MSEGTQGHDIPAGTDEPGRYFLAVWPDPHVRERLGEWSSSVRTGPPARRVEEVNLHMTLVFLGRLDPRQLEAVRKVGAATTWSGASLILDRVGYWKRSRIIWAGCGEDSPSLSALAEDLGTRLRRLGFRVDSRPFVPHVTLFRKAQRRPRWEHRHVEWRINEFCLAESRLSSSGARYTVLDRWSALDDMK